jgi:hypothetical protein
MITWETLRSKEYKEKVYITVAKIVIKYGSLGNGQLNFKEEYVREFWKYDEDLPVAGYILKNIKLNVLKWYIHNKIDYDDGIWNADFIYGISTNGKLIWSKKRFPSLVWDSSEVSMSEVIKTNKLGGKIKEYKIFYVHINTKWSQVPALYLKHSEDTISFMAGLMSVAQDMVIDGVTYASFNKNLQPYLNKWGIPIEKEIKIKRKVKILVSPIWPALFSIKMPLEMKCKWLNIKKPYKSDIYAPVLWRTYVDNAIVTDGIPYLRSRRSVYNDFADENGLGGLKRKLDLLRIEHKLTQLDNRVKEVIQMWAKTKGIN